MSNGNPPEPAYSDAEVRVAPDDTYARRPASEGSSVGKILLALGLLLLIGGGGWYFWSSYFAKKPEPVAAVAPPVEVPKEAPKAAGPQFPVDAGASMEPLPKLAESDKPMMEGLTAAIDRDALARYFVSQDFVRRTVATVDNLPRKSYAQRLSPLKPVPGKFEVAPRDGQLSIGPQNAARYTPMVRTLEAVNSEKLVALYVRFYPLFQEAYRELGYPQGYFNDRLVEALDVMIATRDQPGQLAVTQPKILYEYADPALEALPAGQKLMLRMGPENAARAKVKLKEIRALVAQQGAAMKAAGK